MWNFRWKLCSIRTLLCLARSILTKEKDRDKVRRNKSYTTTQLKLFLLSAFDKYQIIIKKVPLKNKPKKQWNKESEITELLWKLTEITGSPFSKIRN